MNWVGRYYGTSRGPVWLKHSGERRSMTLKTKGKEQGKFWDFGTSFVCGFYDQSSTRFYPENINDPFTFLKDCPSYYCIQQKAKKMKESN